MVEPGTVRKLLETIERRLRRLDALSAVRAAEYRRSEDLQDIAERNFEVLIQACIDLGLHLLADLPAPLPETNRAVFPTLAREGWIDDDLAGRLEGMAGFRNLLAHGYADLIPDRVHAALGELEDVRSYVFQISQASPLREALG